MTEAAKGTVTMYIRNTAISAGIVITMYIMIDGGFFSQAGTRLTNSQSLAIIWNSMKWGGITCLSIHPGIYFLTYLVMRLWNWLTIRSSRDRSSKFFSKSVDENTA